MPAPKEKNNLRSRPPIVVVMGHVDHGKTTLLDAIRKGEAPKEKKDNIQPTTETESGGITQHIGAYEIKHLASSQKPKLITFVDTPGHEAFSAMRLRGTRLADIALLVVAADDGVKPQTKEALEYIKESELSFVVVINKTDKAGADAEKVKNELAELEVLVEGRGGKVPVAEVSALEGKNIDELLDLILLVADLEELTYDPVAPSEGFVLEAHRDPKRGVTTRLVVTNGTLRTGDLLVCGTTYGKVKIMEDFTGRRIKGAVPSMPLQVIGIENLAVAGDYCRVVFSEEEAQNLMAENKSRAEERLKDLTVEPNGQEKVFSLIVKADTVGSLEAVVNSLQHIHSDTVGIKVVNCAVGSVGEADVKFAEAAKVPICGFRVEITREAQQYAEQKGIEIKNFEVIYDFIDAVREAMSRLLEPELVRTEIGKAKILAVFRTEPNRMIVGGKVMTGKLRKGATAEVLRDDQSIGLGKIIQLKQGEEQKEEIGKGKESGILYEGKERIKEGDTLVAFIEEKVYPKL